ncbi:uncharacterized protein [Spinacia oleracea]|uniref:Aminotransferase-like plant mobile domain-containing protein n=1 Tax=Spinacia oleracea TaxID=3562 RepID=A0A9R0JRW0_SPIOL|nr:uncharacterized protein LOC110784677 [Spinacia oleracea]
MWVREAGFQSLLDPKFLQVDRFFLSWLSGRWDPDTQLLRIRDDYEIKIDEEMVGRIFGLQFSSNLLEIEDPCAKDTEYLKIKSKYSNKWGIGHGTVLDKLEKHKSKREKFLRDFILYSFGCLFCAVLNNYISPSLCWLLKQRYLLDNPLKWNWAHYVLKVMKSEHKNGGNKAGVKGGALVLMIAYLDRMNLGDKVQIWDIEFARLGMWQQPDLDYAIGKDTCEGGYVVAEVVRTIDF